MFGLASLMSWMFYKLDPVKQPGGKSAAIKVQQTVTDWFFPTNCNTQKRNSRLQKVAGSVVRSGSGSEPLQKQAAVWLPAARLSQVTRCEPLQTIMTVRKPRRPMPLRLFLPFRLRLPSLRFLPPFLSV